MEFRDYLRILRRRWLLILGATLLAGGLAAAFAFSQTPQYASSARIFVSTAGVDDSQLLQGGQYSTQRVKSYADLVDSRKLADMVADDLDLDVPASTLVDRARATIGSETVNLTITFTHTDPAEAQRIADSYARNMAGLVRELETPPGDADPPIKATIVDNASYSEVPVEPDVLRIVLLGLAGGLMLGIGLAAVRELLDNRVHSTDELASLLDAPTLGVIGFDPDFPKRPLVSEIPPHSPRSEAFRVLRTNLQFVNVDSRNNIFVITSALPGEGKTSTAINLALSLAQAGSRTLLLECDLRRPKSAERLQMDGAIGVTNVLVGDLAVEEAIQVHEESGLHLLASGRIPANPAELLQTNAMADLLDKLRSAYDAVIVDSPPLLPVTDGAVLAAKADGTILVVRHNKVTKDQIHHAATRLAQVDASIVGTVVTMVPHRGKGYGYGYGYGYDYSSLSRHRKAEAEQPRKRSWRRRAAAER